MRGEAVYVALFLSLVTTSVLALLVLYVRTRPSEVSQNTTPEVHIISTPHTNLATVRRSDIEQLPDILRMSSTDPVNVVMYPAV